MSQINKQGLSVIIPVYNEEKVMARLLDSLAIFSEDHLEIIFVDGGSQDRTLDLIQVSDYRLVQSQKGRGRQLHAGFLASSYPNLLFLHADNYFDQSPVEEIYRILEEHPIGAFKIRFRKSSPVLNLIAWGSHWRLKYRNIAFGDQGIFMRRDFYEKMDGFRPLPLMEDYDFSLRVKARNHTIYASQQNIYASSRRFDQVGGLKMLWIMQKCQAMFRRGEPLEKIIDVYYQS